MLVKEAIDHFGGVNKLASALGITRQCVSMWTRDKGGIVPELQAYKLMAITNGQLRVMGGDDDN